MRPDGTSGALAVVMAMAVWTAGCDEPEPTPPTTVPATSPAAAVEPAPPTSAPVTHPNPFVNRAFQELVRMNLSTDREPVVTESGDLTIVEFPPPAGALAGSFIFQFHTQTGELRDTKIWR